MIYSIKKYGDHFFRNLYSISNENGVIEYTLNTTGFILNQILFPDYLIKDRSGKEIMQATKDKAIRRNRHLLIQSGKEMGVVEESTIHHYIIKIQNSDLYELQLSGLGSDKWQVISNNEPIAKIRADWKKWGWRVDLSSVNNMLFLLVGLALIYNYFQDA
jgi:hypothetical protein